MRKNYIVIIILFAVVALVVWMCSGDNSEETNASKGKGSETALKVGLTPTLDCLPLFVAYDDSMFFSNGLDIRLVEYQSEIDCDTALVGGSLDMGVSNVVRAQRLIRKRTPLTFFSSTNRRYSLVTCGGSRIKKLTDLNGKLVGIARFSASDFLAERSIDSVKLSRTGVYRVQINDYGIRMRMLINNELEGALLTEPQATEAVNLNNVRCVDYGDCLGVIVMRADKMQKPQKKSQLELFKKVYDMAVDSINKNGIGHYRNCIMQHCHVKGSTVDSLRTVRFTHITPVDCRAIDAAQNWLNKH